MDQPKEGAAESLRQLEDVPVVLSQTVREYADGTITLVELRSVFDQYGPFGLAWERATSQVTRRSTPER